jgi:serine/threonine protein kinase/cytochrome c-type biogenesis protein CcmH/NrfG
MIGKSIGHYRVLGKLGEGGMGVVYRARDEKLQREVALKFLPPDLAMNPEARQRLLQEARAASRLSHPNIATIYEVGEADGTPFIALELVSGESLKQMIERGRLPRARLTEIARQIAAGLNEAHQARVFHRDIKPGNIMVDAKGRVKILDFGLAVFAGRERGPEETAENFVTRTATQWSTGGTVPYMPPEQLRGEATDARSDIFSFGVLLYQCLAGRLPFPGETAIDILHAILRQPPVPLRSLVPDVPPDWERLVERCLAKPPEGRFQSMQEVIEALAGLGADEKTAEKSLAVLYFENLSPAKEDEYFRDGMTEDIITELLKIKQLRIFPRSAVVPFRDKPAAAAEIGQQLNASYAVTGSLRRAGNRVRISAQLLDVRSGFPVWAERYDRQLEDVFEIQDEIARSIAQALRVTLSPQEEKAIAQKPTENPQAYDYLLRGRGYARRVTRPDLEFAMQMYERAIALDPNFALAYAGLANTCGLIYEWHEENERWIEKGQVACERALALGPGLAEALAAQARIFYSQKRNEEAIRYARMALERKPDCEGAYWTLGQAYFVADRFEEITAIADRAIEMAGDDYNVYIPLMLTFDRLGQAERAHSVRERSVRALEQQLEQVPEDVRARILLAVNHAALGSPSQAVRELEQAVALRPNDSNILYNAACVYGRLALKTEALALLRKAKQKGYHYMDWASRDPDLACLHDDPEFKQLVAEPPRS